MEGIAMRKFILVAAVVGVALLTASCGGVVNRAGDPRMPVRGITVFGDSSSDVGTYADATGDPRNPGKFTVNPGKLWVENIAEHYGLALTPYRALSLDKDASSGAGTEPGRARILGGNGYAEGGARVLQRPMQSGVGNNAIVLSVTEQLDAHLSKNGKFAPNHLVIITGGGNDSYAQFAALCWQLDNNGDGGKTTMAGAVAAMDKAASDQLANIRRIKDAGAGVILVSLASDWSVNPFAKKYLSAAYTGCKQAVSAAQIAAWTEQFNQRIRDGLRGVAGVIFFTTHEVYRAASANPQGHGLVNVTDAACNNTRPTNSAAFCTRATLVAPDADQTYMWSDSFHGTPGMHKLLSDKALAMLDVVAQRAQ
ncbi:hypothetical protein D8B34_21460 [Verminephrobacter eiseniae]|nr:hypothetical protein ET532_021870 [Verminephrobacter sp. Larva24]MCW5231755.1 hypothetical protein [Verminephrobacter eiseniae]MCW5293487.1 hypothetical protein [Verminephrobacter eiseniae]MCW8187070.1 hypothetical protein [Verminephrobacter eiseniae]MCW8225551.1 hypothetical protein [Verminephrobacter eiseniae]